MIIDEYPSSNSKRINNIATNLKEARVVYSGPTCYTVLVKFGVPPSSYNKVPLNLEY